MRLLLSRQITQRLQRELQGAGRREIGGLLLGEHVGDDVFRLVDFTVQHSGGTKACFVRRPHEHQAELNRFFERTGANYTRFNYLGEWHSHPSFAAVPSSTDIETMQSIVSDPSVGANFLVLMIVRLATRHQMHFSAAVYRPDELPTEVQMELEQGDSAETEWSATTKGSVVNWVRRILRW